MVYVSPELYDVVKDSIWDRGVGGFVMATGKKMPDLQMVIAQGIEFPIISTEPVKEYVPG